MFDPDYDHPMESVLMGHPERQMPFCVERYRVLDEAGTVLAACTNNHQARNIIALAHPVTTRALRIELTAPSPPTPAALFEVRWYAGATAGNINHGNQSAAGSHVPAVGRDARWLPYQRP